MPPVSVVYDIVQEVPMAGSIWSCPLLKQCFFFQTVSLFLAIGILCSTAFGFPSIRFVFNIVPAVGSVR